MEWCLGGGGGESGARGWGKTDRTENVLEGFTSESAVERVQERVRSRLFHPFEFLVRTFAAEDQSEFRQSILHRFVTVTRKKLKKPGD